MEMKLSEEQKRRVIASIQECDRFIDKEEKRDASLRPLEVTKILESTKKHKAKLQAMLVSGSMQLN